MFTYREQAAFDDGGDSLGEAFRAMRHAMEQSLDWQETVPVEAAPAPRGGLRSICAERTAIAKKAAEARWAKKRARDSAPD